MMITKFLSSALSAIAVIAGILHIITLNGVNGDDSFVKMCLYYKAAGHVRSDPILNQACASDHVHTFYGPQQFHPNTTNEDLRNSNPKYSTSVYEENQSLYWHPSIYKVGRNAATGEATYELAEISFTGPYYRWDKNAPAPAVEAFPKGFQMIAGMDPKEIRVNLFSECLCPKKCTRSDGLCESKSDIFPSTACGEMGIAMAFPTCWDDSKGLGNSGDHMSHMAYTLNGEVDGKCPEGFNRRLPQIQLFVRIADYEGGQYTFSDNTLPGDEEVFHADFMNGWIEGKLEEIIDGCDPIPNEGDSYNPPCTCDQFLTKKSNLLASDTELGRNDAEAANICPIDPKTYIIDEEINFVESGGLPRGLSCSIIEKIPGVDPPFVDECGLVFTPNTFDEESCEEGSGDGENENGGQDEDNASEDEDVEGNGDEEENENQEIESNVSEDEDTEGSGDEQENLNQENENNVGEDENEENDNVFGPDENQNVSNEEINNEKCENVLNKFVFKVTKKGKVKKKKCSWVEKKLKRKRKEKKKKKFCKKKTSEGVTIGMHCPVTCNLC